MFCLDMECLRSVVCRVEKAAKRVAGWFDWLRIPFTFGDVHEGRIGDGGTEGAEREEGRGGRGRRKGGRRRTGRDKEGGSGRGRVEGNGGEGMTSEEGGGRRKRGEGGGGGGEIGMRKTEVVIREDGGGREGGSRKREGREEGKREGRREGRRRKIVQGGGEEGEVEKEMGGGEGVKDGQGSEEMVASEASFNGFVSSIQLFIFVSILFSVLILSSVLSKDFGENCSRIFMSVCMLSGMVVMLWLYRRREHLLLLQQPAKSVDRDRNQSTVNAEVRSQRGKGPLAGIVTFYVLGCFHDFLHVLVHFSCPEVWTNCRSSAVLRRKGIAVALHLIRIIYLACQTLFCMIFNRSRFADRSSIRHGLMLLQAVNVCMWLSDMVDEAKKGMSERSYISAPEMQRYAKECGFTVNASGNASSILACLSNNYSLRYYQEMYGDPILRPFNIEYALLVGECLAYWFISCGKRFDSVKRGRHGSVDTYVDAQRQGHGLMAQSSDVGESSAVNEAERSLESAEECSPLLKRRRPSSWSRYMTMFLLFLSITVNLLLAVFVFVPRILESTLGLSTPQNAMRSIASVYSFFYYILMTISVAIGYHISSGFRIARNVPFTGLNYLLIFSSSGSLAFDIFRLLAISGSEGGRVFRKSSLRFFYAGYVFFELIQISFQVAFSLYAERLRLNREDDTPRSVVFRSIVLFLALCNVTTWFVQTFASSLNSQSLMVGYYGALGWGFINNALVPIFLFFRFNSFLLFVKISRRLYKPSILHT